MHNAIDTSTAQFFNHYVHRSQIFDAMIFQISHNHLFKGAVLYSIIAYAWFKVQIENEVLKKKTFLTIFVAAIAAILIARLVAIISPFRYRPIYDPQLHLQLPFSIHGGELNGWSSFPSDHAALFFAISLAIFFLHKRLGLFAIAYTVLFICVPRLILGFHFLTDIIAGAVIGGFVSWLVFRTVIHSKLLSSLVAFSESKPQFFYPIFLFFTYQLYEMFERMRDVFPTLRWAVKELIVFLG